MNCKTVESRLSAYIDRELGGDELLQIRAHLSSCKSCREEAEGLKALKMLLGSVQCPDPSEDLAQRLTASVLRERFDSPRTNFRASAFMFAGIAACSMLVTLLLVNVGARHGISNPPVASSNAGGGSRPDASSGFDTLDQGSPLLSAANYVPR